MPDRFDNVSTSDLVARYAEITLEREAVLKAAKERLVSECAIQVGKTYRVAAGRFKGRLMLVGYVIAQEGFSWHRDEIITVTVQGRLRFVGRGHTPTSDGFGRRSETVLPENLEGPI